MPVVCVQHTPGLEVGDGLFDDDKGRVNRFVVLSTSRMSSSRQGLHCGVSILRPK